LLSDWVWIILLAEKTGEVVLATVYPEASNIFLWVSSVAYLRADSMASSSSILDL
jgi:hypothetical protein